MKERDYLLATTTARASAIGDIARGMISVRGVATEREIKTLRRIAALWGVRGHAAIQREGEA